MFRKRYTQLVILSTLASLLLILIRVGAAAGASTSQDTSTDAEVVEAAGVQANCHAFTDFDPRNFSNSARINNNWFPLLPGTRFVLNGRANRTGESLPHEVIFTVTDLTKMIHGVRTLVVWDRDINDGVLSEEELAFFAQDNDGNVWSLGEYPEEDENGQFSGAPSTWISGLRGAQAGIAMLAKPEVGKPDYLQGKALSVEFLDCGQVFAKHQMVPVPVGSYAEALEIDEWSPRDPESGHQRKFYARGVGNIQIAAVDDPEGETLVLTEYTHLGKAALAEARKKVQELDDHGYKVSKVYSMTPPVEYWRGIEDITSSFVLATEPAETLYLPTIQSGGQ